LCLAGLACGLGWLLVRRRFRALLLALGACATVLPAALVADWYWLGFDRYLYLPALLLVWAALPAPGPMPRRWVAFVGVALVILFTSTLLSGRFYRSHSEWIFSMIDARPEDPSGYAWAARDMVERGQPDAARDIMRKVPPSEASPPVAHAVLLTFIGLNMRAEAAALVDATYGIHPNNLNVKFDVMHMRADQNRWAECVALAREFVVHPAFRAGTLAFINNRLAVSPVPPAERAQLEALRR
jgi:hypothetical protein